MKLIKSIAIIGTTALLVSNPVFADDFNTVVNFHPDVTGTTNHKSVVEPVVTIQDYIDRANRENGKISTNDRIVGDLRSRWQKDQIL